MTCNNPKLDLINMNAYIKFSENLSICSKDIERKRNSGVNQGPYFWYKCPNNDVLQSQSRSCKKMSISMHIQNSVKFYKVILKILIGNEMMTDRRNEGWNNR